jgi:hypothetical protein
VGKNEKNLKLQKELKKKVSVLEKKIGSDTIPELDLGFGSRYRNLVKFLVAHYFWALLHAQSSASFIT